MGDHIYTYPNDKEYHEEDVEGKVDLLLGAFFPREARFCGCHWPDGIQVGMEITNL